MTKVEILFGAIIGVVVAFLMYTQVDSQQQGPPYGMPYELETEGEEYTAFLGKWNHTCISYRTTDATLADLTDQSLNAVWGSVSPIRSCGNVTSGEDVTIVGVPTGSLGSNVLGQAGCSASGGFMVHCDIKIAGNGRFLGVLAHELGHTLGLGHSQRGDQLMSAYCCNPLGSDDIAGIQFLYGPGSGPIPTPTGTIIHPTPLATIIPPTTAGCIGVQCITPTLPATATVRPTSTPTRVPTAPPSVNCTSDGTCLIGGRWVDRYGNIWLEDREVWWDGRDPAHYYVGGLWLNGDGTIYGGVG